MAEVYSAGHGNRSVEALIELLVAAGIRRLVDVRAVPRSRRYPHFGYGPLGAALQAAGIAYEWRGQDLGGLRRGESDLQHPALKEPAFRAFATHMACRPPPPAMRRAPSACLILAATPAPHGACCIAAAAGSSSDEDRAVVVDVG
ncbi:MAG: DUF488 domain-containing protein, partial [Betaproteobacteria bacterium]|nr:DUF488 domain-containing protein [Betaproteobacteria bacterium]